MIQSWCCGVPSHQARLLGRSGKLVGDTLLAAAFVSYAGPFSIPFRRALVLDKWLPDLHERAIPLSEGVTPLDILTNDAAKVPAKTLLYSCPYHASNVV